jgi:hypothetical protein
MCNVVGDINKTTNFHMIVYVAVQTLVNGLFMQVSLCFFLIS